MSRNFRNIEFPRNYKYSSDSDHIPLEFYNEVFPLSIKIDLLLGYFSTNAFKAISESFAEFIYYNTNSTIRIITNHHLNALDKENLLNKPELAKEDEVIDIFKDVEKLKSELSSYGQHFFDCLKYLLKQNRLKIFPVKFNKVDLAHCKRMIFYDGENTITTDGSINFTFNAFCKNGESFSIDADWLGQKDEIRVKDEIDNFEKIFSKKHKSYNYISVDEVEEVIYATGRDKDLDDLVEDSINLDDKSDFNEKLKKIRKIKNEKFNKKLIEMRQEPHFPIFDGKIAKPRQYQVDAYKAWVKNNYKGIFAMATGTGKTITSLNCLLEVYNNSERKIYKAVVLVPTIVLVDQWEQECLKFNFNRIIKVNSKAKWKDTLSSLKALSFLGKEKSFIIITTYASFVKPNFQAEFNNLGLETILIADEAHNIGSPTIKKLLPHIKLQKRIGLSATPERQFADEDNLAINNFFNENNVDIQGYTYEYSMEDAIKNKVLCKYRYYPKLVRLTDEEFEQYVYFSRKIMQFPEPRSKQNQLIYDSYIRKRVQIIHKASNKIEIYKYILRNEFNTKKHLKYTLVYTPEGMAEENRNIKKDYYNESDDEIRIINDFTREVSAYGVSVKQYTGRTNSEDRKKILDDFRNGNVQVLTSMKCLDEGVDVPRAEVAIFCSSTGNPRQFIQRRGRILRNHDDKDEAVIYDLIVVPEISEREEYYNFERNEIKKELKRVTDFAALSENSYEAFSVLKSLLKYYNLNI